MSSLVAGVTEGTTGKDIHDDTLSGEVIRVVEWLASVDLCNEVLVGCAVNEGISLNNPDELLNRVVEVELDLVGGGGDGFSTSELELLNQILVCLLGESSSLLSVQIHVVNVEGGSSQGLDGGCGCSGASQLIVAAVDPLLELNIDADLVVLEGNQWDSKTWVSAEPELERDVEGLGWCTRSGSARVGELGTSARGIQGITTSVLHEDEIVGVTDHVVEGCNGTCILGELGPDLEPVAILSVNSLTSNLELNDLEQSVTDVVEPSESVQVGGTGCEVDCWENNLDVCAVHQVGVTVDDCSHTLVEVGLAVEGNLNGFHGEVCMALVKHLPEGNLGIT